MEQLRIAPAHFQRLPWSNLELLQQTFMRPPWSNLDLLQLTLTDLHGATAPAHFDKTSMEQLLQLTLKVVHGAGFSIKNFSISSPNIGLIIIVGKLLKRTTRI
jgi:glycosyltransferase A (GT-A) superfamily protein (DUF2064 family)